MTVVTKPAAPKKAIRELKNLRTSTRGQSLKLAFCHGCHAVHPDRSK
ncbi:MAG: hypothetical protein HYX69_09065 [Planctomycetia bacterium]|nr:hypothetical protein [Planctomycetia bacterium]